jgi:hypothetical protein
LLNFLNNEIVDSWTCAVNFILFDTLWNSNEIVMKYGATIFVLPFYTPTKIGVFAERKV